MSIVVKQTTRLPQPDFPNLGKKPRVFDLLMYAERREFDNSDCYWGGELDGVWDSKRIETNGVNHVKLFLVLLKCNASVNSTCAQPPPHQTGNRGAFASLVSPGGGALANLA